MDYKELFIEKYNYLYNNADFFCSITNNKEILDVIEELFLSDGDLDKCYEYLEKCKNNKEYLKKYKEDLEFIKKLEGLNKKMGLKFVGNSMVNLTRIVYDSVSKQTKIKSLMKKKKEVLDEFARVARYTNSSKKWTSGVKINDEDAYNYNIDRSCTINRKALKERIEKPILVSDNKFIQFFSNSEDKKDAYHFTDYEMQQIYLMNHEEFPYNYKVLCNDNGDINRPEDSKSCKSEFVLEKENIYIDNSGNFLTVCPNCGYINIVVKETLDKNTLNEIVENSSIYDEKINYNKSEIIILSNKAKKKHLKK